MIQLEDVPPASLEGGQPSAAVDSPSEGQPSTCPAAETCNHGQAQPTTEQPSRTSPPNEVKAGRPGGNQPKTQNGHTYRVTALYVSHLERMTQRELSDHCTATLMQAIAESQARQIAIRVQLASRGIHPHAYDANTHHHVQTRTTRLAHDLAQRMVGHTNRWDAA